MLHTLLLESQYMFNFWAFNLWYFLILEMSHGQQGIIQNLIWLNSSSSSSSSSYLC